MVIEVAVGAITVNVALPIFPCALAEIVVVPALTAVTFPDCETVATAVLDEVQAKVCPAMAC